MNDESIKVIKERGYRLTPQRQIILDVLQEAGDHCTPEEVYQRVQTRSSAINRTTVYRTLEFLVRLGLVTTAHVQSNQVIYELASDHPHHHLVCQHCDKVEIIEHELFASMFAELEQQSGYKINTDHLVLFGVCPHCQRAEAHSLRSEQAPGDDLHPQDRH
jgi:Fur family ferric uptake transcriptional regulator